MKKHIFITLFLFLSIMSIAQNSNNKYETDWKRVEELDKQSLPQSSALVVDSILRKAIADKNNTQVIKAIIYKNKFKLQIDNTDNKGIFEDLQSLVTQTEDVAEKSLLYSMIAELYATYYMNDQWTIRQRSKLINAVPEDMQEWSSNIFIDKVAESIDLSIKNASLLKQHTTKEYDDIILLGTDGQKYYPTLYDFLMSRAIEITKTLEGNNYDGFDSAVIGVDAEKLALPADEYVKLNLKTGADKSYISLIYYQRYLKDLLSRNLTSTIVLIELDKVDYLKRYSRSLSNEKLVDILLSLEKKYRGDVACAEIINVLVDAYNYKAFDTTTGSDINKIKYDWLKLGISRYPNTYGAALLQSKLNDMESPAIRIDGETLQYPSSSMKLNLFHKNVQSLKEKPQFRLYKVEDGKYSLQKDYTLNLVSQTVYNLDSLNIDLGNLAVGRYCFTSLSTEELKESSSKQYDEKNINRFDFVVSRLATFARNSGNKEYEMFVVDRQSGKPIKGADVEIYSSKNNRNDEDKLSLIKKIKTNDLGLASFKYDEEKNNNVLIYKAVLDADSCLDKETIYNSYRWNRTETREQTSPAISIFTDRSIYRPGQTVFVKAIAINPDSKPLTGKSYSIKLYNANNDIVAQKEVNTNDFGSASTEFVLPSFGLLGTYRIQVGNNSIYFQVEEYKRPTFEITFDKVDKTYTFGEEVKLKGYAKNFSGINLQQADVKYTISRQQFNFWFWYAANKTHFADGTVKTNDDGSFEIVFTPEMGDGNIRLLRGTDRQVYTFTITATVTDINGETQSNDYSLTVGNVSMLINIGIADQIEKSSDFDLAIEARNLQAQNINTSGTYVLYQLNSNDSIESKVYEGSFNTGDQPELKAKLKNLPSGKYQLEAKALDDKGNEVTESKNFVLYSFSDKRPPIKTNEWLVVKNDTWKDDDKPVEIIFGTTEKDTYILYQLSQNEQILDRSFIKLSNENKTFSIPYKAIYGDEINMSLTSVKDGNFYHRNISLKKEGTKLDTKLNVKLDVFRDKLRPGEAETWTISVKDSTNSPVLAELLASMYDSSLDKLYPYVAWALNRPGVSHKYINPIYYNYTRESVNNRSFYLGNVLPIVVISERTFDHINWFGYRDYFRRYGGIFNLARTSGITLGGNAYISEAVAPSAIMRQKSVDRESTASLSEDMAVDSSIIEEKAISPGQNTGQVSPQLRQNFNETAFFYPRLKTNEKGEVQLSFTVPESNTTWRFRALAHDKDGRVGVLEQMVVTRKELMVTPNMPRFVRQGDKTSVSTKVSNLSEVSVSGNVVIEFFDPMTDKVIDLKIDNKEQLFSIEKDASTSASWIFTVPQDIEMIGCRIIAQTESFSDGEQHALAVLPNRMLVTESMPIDIVKEGTSTFTFDKLYNNTVNNNYRLTLEYASNPAWYAIQALPTMSNPTNENAVNWFASYYVNSLGNSIVRQYPKVMTMIKAWKKQGADKQTLISKLQKDEELKAVLLEETPWVLDARNETEQMQRLSLLLDLNNTEQLLKVSTSKLAELVTIDGGWSWYKGLRGNRGVTQYILYGYAKLQEVARREYSQDVKEMQIGALQFIDKQIVEDFNNLKKYDKNWETATHISTAQLEYAYVRSFYRDIPINQEARAAERFYTDVASKNWTNLNLYERAILSIVLKRNGDKTLAGKIVQSIREHAVKDPKQGMYWPNNKRNAFLSMSAISTHTFLMEALQQNGATTEEIDLMKRWLINQKRTQLWESTHASVDAISVLLSSGSDWFSVNPTLTTIKVGERAVDMDKSELGTGYVKQSWSKSEIDNKMGKVKITSTSAQSAYGGLFWQYYEDLNKITAQKGELNIDKELFKENVSAIGSGLMKITENNPLTVGDKVVVRLTIRVDRDMDFVQLKDMRAPCFEPLQTISGVTSSDRLIYYQTVKDASTNFYFDHLSKGTYVLEYPVYVNRSGEYANGITTIQSMYAPEFVSHTQGIKVIVKD